MKRAIRAGLSAVVLAAALILQLTVVNRLRPPGAGAPDLVLLAVVALALCGTPATGAVTGFCAGLSLDLAPPGSYLVGEYALVFCVVGYVCGRMRAVVGRSATAAIAAAMVAAAAGEALTAGFGRAVSDPQVTWAAVRQVLPSAVIFDVVLAPFVLFGVMWAVRWADGLGRARAAWPEAGGVLSGASRGSSGAGTTTLGGAGLLGGAGWLAGPVGARRSLAPRRAGSGRGPRPHRTPRLREAAARSGDGWLGGAPRTGLPAPARRGPARPGRPPRLRPGSGTPGSAVARPPRTLPRPPANLRIGSARRGDGLIGRVPGSAGLSGPAVRGVPGRGRSGPPGSAFRGQRRGAPAVHARSGGLSRGARSHSPSFRPDRRLRGGSASGGVLTRGSPLNGISALDGGGRAFGGSAAQRLRPGRQPALRLRSKRRHDGMVGGRTPGHGVAAGLGATRGLTARPVRLRLGSGRRGDGTLGGRSGSRGVFASPRLPARRRAEPRFRSGPAFGGHALLGRGTRLRAGKRPRLRSPASSWLASWTGGRLGGRSTVWRIGSSRTGGLR